MKKFTLTKCAASVFLTVIVGSTALAQERPVEVEETITTLDRYSAIADIVGAWNENMSAYEGWEAEFTAALNGASDEQLLAIQNAGSYNAVGAILQGRPAPVALEGVAGVEALGDITSDLTYTPVVPCRFFDTRFDNIAGPGHTTGATATTHSYYVEGSAGLLFHQGYNKGVNAGAGCPAPNGEAVGVAANFTAAGPLGNGNLRAWPFGGSLPNVSLVNYTSGTNIANAAIVATGYLIGNDINVTMQFGTVDALGDVMGYFYPVDTNDPAFNEVDFAGYSSGSSTAGTLPVTTSYQFIGPTDTATVPSGYKVLLNAMQAVGTTTTADDLDIAPCYLESPYTGNPTIEGLAVFGLEMNSDTRVPISITGVINPGAGTYRFGMCYRTDVATWNNNEYGYVSILVVRD